MLETHLRTCVNDPAVAALTTTLAHNVDATLPLKISVAMACRKPKKRGRSRVLVKHILLLFRYRHECRSRQDFDPAICFVGAPVTEPVLAPQQRSKQPLTQCTRTSATEQPANNLLWID